MDRKNELLKKIPKMDILLAHISENQIGKTIPYAILHDCAREILADLRISILSDVSNNLPTLHDLAVGTVDAASKRLRAHLRRVINGTGIILHTNLGRARMSEQIGEIVKQAVTTYSTLEYCLESGKRGSRHSHVDQLLCYLTGCEAAMVVNNNAAAIMLALSALARGKEVIVSRGELVEIGGSFRVPEIMAESGSILKEVGSTNKTHLSDYANAIDIEKTGALLKVHTSNFKILGFSESVALADLAKLGKEKNLPVIYDLGSGALLDLNIFGKMDEPSVKKCLETGVDALCFSGDKLLGGPQAGIILGEKSAIESMKKHPLARAFRIDKLSLAALEATLNCYLDADTVCNTIPTLNMLTISHEQLLTKAELLANSIINCTSGLLIKPINEMSEVGGGSLPGEMLDTWVVSIEPVFCSINELEKRLRDYETPIIGRISRDHYLLDMRTIDTNELEIIINAFSELFPKNVGCES